MIPGWQMAAYERLRTAIVRSVVNDLKRAMRESDRLGVVSDRQKELEDWFLSRWGQMLSGDNGEFIIEKCRQTYKGSFGRKSRQRIPEDVQKRICEEYIKGESFKAIMQRYDITPGILYGIVRRWQ
jgi:hypothetical protein